LVLQAALGRRADIAVFSRDYDTPDGARLVANSSLARQQLG
jgi:UDP-glucose 4-epimerase